ncbi:GntR family transcriptional regulator [Azospirillum doebereinerae]
MPEFLDANATETYRSEQVGTIMVALRNLVLEGTLPPGSKLRETELAARFGVSRTPVREALVAAEREGLVTYELNRGYAVRQFSLHDLLENYELRGLLEGHGCRIVAERGLPSDVERSLWGCLDRAEALVSGDAPLEGENLDTWRALNQRFHTTLMDLVPSGLFERMFQLVYRVPKIYDILSMEGGNPVLRQYNDEHRRILDAIVRRQSGRAEFLVREHLRGPCDLISRRLAEADKPPKERSGERSGERSRERLRVGGP